MNTDFSARLKKIMDYRNVKQTDLVEMTGISKGAISSYLKGDYVPKQKNTFIIGQRLNVEPTWLLGHGDIDKIEPFSQITLDDVTEENRRKLIPILGNIAAGLPILAEQNVDGYFHINDYINADFALKVKGDSMINAGIYSDDIVFIRQQQNLENGEIGAILLDNEATLKKFYRDNGTIILQAENDKYKPKVFTSGNIKILGKLVAVLNIRF